MLKVDVRDYKNDLSSTNMGSDIFGQHVTIERLIGFSVYVKYSGSPVGSFYLEASLDPDDPTKFDQVPQNWEKIECSEVVVNGAGSQVWNVDAAYFRWFRLVYKSTSGSGTVLNCSYLTKGP